MIHLVFTSKIICQIICTLNNQISVSCERISQLPHIQHKNIDDGRGGHTVFAHACSVEQLHRQPQSPTSNLRPSHKTSKCPYPASARCPTHPLLQRAHRSSRCLGRRRPCPCRWPCTGGIFLSVSCERISQLPHIQHKNIDDGRGGHTVFAHACSAKRRVLHIPVTD